MPDHQKPVSELLTNIYKVLDHAVTDPQISCKKGCASCCYLLTAITLAEGILIAERLLNTDNWRDLLPKLREASLAHCYEGVGKVSYLKKRVPCVFLTKENTCSIYEFRPGTCRYHLVVSHPDRCHPDHPSGETAALDTIPLQEKVWELSFHVAEQNGMVDIAAPIPIMVLFCMKLIADEGKGKRLILQALEGIPTPSEFLERFHSTVVDSADTRRVSPSDEELKKLVTKD